MAKISRPTNKKKETLRQKAERSSKSSGEKKRRIRNAAGLAGKPFKKAWEVGKTEYHVIPQKESGFLGWLTRSRSLFPKYFINSQKELKQVTWPDRRTSWKLVLAVYMFAFFFGLLIALADFGLEKAMKQLLLK